MEQTESQFPVPRPEVRENVFQQTGFGINVAQNSQPVIVGNQIQYNRVGVIVQAKARPILRNNLIQGSKEDGLVALALAVPNLGSTSEPGGNEFRNNTRHDINASAAKEIFPAFGNKINQNRIAGKVDFTGNVAIPICNHSGSWRRSKLYRNQSDDLCLGVTTSPSIFQQNPPAVLPHQLTIAYYHHRRIIFYFRQPLQTGNLYPEARE